MATISNVNGKKITKIKYKGEIFDVGGGGGSGDTNTLKTLLDATKSAVYLFNKYSGTSVSDLISYSDTENVTEMEYMFFQCLYVTIIPQLNTSNVKTMKAMFYDCQNLTIIPQLNTSNVKTMESMFYDCYNLSTILQLDTSSVTNMSNMFRDCHNLTKIDITHMKITSTFDANYFARNCYSLTKLIIRNMDVIPRLNENSFNSCYHFTGTADPTYNPQGLKDGRIYVPDDKVDALKTATNWSVYADIIVPLSTLVE